jgi:hypothetical protein
VTYLVSVIVYIRLRAPAVLARGAV